MSSIDQIKKITLIPIFMLINVSNKIKQRHNIEELADKIGCHNIREPNNNYLKKNNCPNNKEEIKILNKSSMINIQKKLGIKFIMQLIINNCAYSLQKIIAINNNNNNIAICKYNNSKKISLKIIIILVL